MPTFGLFKKGTVSQRHLKAEKPRPVTSTSKDRTREGGTLGDALEEIEKEEAVAAPSKSPMELFARTDRVEDELIHLVGDADLEEAEAEPAPRPVQSISDEALDKFAEYDEKIDDIMVAIGKLSKEARSTREHASQFSEKMERILALFEGDRPAAKEAPSPTSEFIPAKLQFHPFKDEPEEEVMDDLPPFQPFGSGSTIPFSIEIEEPQRAEFVPSSASKLPAFAVELREHGRDAKGLMAETITGEPSGPMIGMPILTSIKQDYLTLTLLMRWIEFLFERVTRDRLSLVLDYYVEIGWISESVKSEIMTYARGEMQDVTKYIPRDEEGVEEPIEEAVSPVAVYKKVDDWRLSTDDHLKSLLFIMKIANIPVDKDRLNSLEQLIKRFKENLEGFHGV